MGQVALLFSTRLFVRQKSEKSRRRIGVRPAVCAISDLIASALVVACIATRFCRETADRAADIIKEYGSGND